ncbi:MAG: YcaO-like family protein [Deltaproteobacteria bacterium]|nr:YcaO-like family protein [Deltaproteobacteria bacterium]
MRKSIVLQDAYKGFTLDQDKIISPKETVQRLKEKLNTVDLDILSHTIRIDNGRLDIPVYFSVCGKDAASVTGTKKQMGKGATPEQAEASATIELAERFSFFSFYNNPDNFIIEPYRNLNDDAVPFEMIAQSVHDESEELELTKTIFEGLTLKWTWGFNLTQNRPLLVPFDWFYTINEFNGTSAGNCTEEALCQGICEIVERHVSSIISQNHLKVPLINPESATDRLVVEMLNKYKHAGINLIISDFSLDMGIPTVGALAYDPSTFPENSELVWTAGTTPNPEKALSRALTEVAQLAGDFDTGSNYVSSGLPKFDSFEDIEFIINPGINTDINTLPDVSHDNIRVEVENCISALLKKNMDIIAVDILHPLLEIPAFYTIIPGSYFRERAMGTSVGMFSAKLIAENQLPDTAVVELEKIDKMLPGKYYIKFYLGLCHISLNNLKIALNHFAQALDLGPTQQDIPTIYAYIGVCLKDMGEYRMALDALEKGCRHDKGRTDIYNLMGFCHYKLKKYEKAIECFNDVIKLNPGSAIDYANIASNYRDWGKTDKALEYYKTALAIDPTINFARENLIKLKKG